MTTVSTAEALRQIGISPNVLDANMEPANLVDALAIIAEAIRRHGTAMEKLADAITANNRRGFPVRTEGREGVF